MLCSFRLNILLFLPCTCFRTHKHREIGGILEPPVTPVGRDELALKRHRFFSDLLSAAQHAAEHRIRFDPFGSNVAGKLYNQIIIFGRSLGSISVPRNDNGVWDCHRFYEHWVQYSIDVCFFFFLLVLQSPSFFLSFYRFERNSIQLEFWAITVSILLPSLQSMYSFVCMNSEKKNVMMTPANWTRIILTTKHMTHSMHSYYNTMFSLCVFLIPFNIADHKIIEFVNTTLYTYKYVHTANISITSAARFAALLVSSK